MPIPVGSLLTVDSRSRNDLGPFFLDMHLDQGFIYKKLKVKFTLEQATRAQNGT